MIRSLLRIGLGVLVVVLGWILAADLELVPGKQAADWLRERLGQSGPPPIPQTRQYDGQALTVSLSEPAAEFYGGARDPEPEDRTFVELSDAADVAYDPALAQAAREYANLYADLNSMLPGDAFAFLLDAAGVVGWGVRQSVMVSNAPSKENTENYVRDVLTEGATRIGVGVAQMDTHQVVVVLSADETLELEPVPRAARAGTPIAIRGRLPEGYQSAMAVAMGPDGEILDLEVIGEARAFATSLDPDAAGLWTVEVLGNGPLGPAPVTQMTLSIDEDPAEDFSGRWPKNETRLRAIHAAEARALELVAADRKRYGLPALQPDPALDAIARAHSVDMRDKDFVGHRSPTTGGPGDRMEAAGYPAIGLAENVAFNRNLGDAQRGLMRSLGHRRNLLSRDLTHIGIGAATDGESWYLTQLFARPMPVVEDLDAARDQVLATLNAARKKPLRSDAEMTTAANREAEAESPSPRGALDQARSALQGKATAWVGRMASLDQFEPPDALLDGQFRKAGVGVYQHTDRLPPNIHVVVLLSQ